MIEDLRFVIRVHPNNSFEAGYFEPKTFTRKVLQAYDGHAWFDVPVYNEEQPK